MGSAINASPSPELLVPEPFVEEIEYGDDKLIPGTFTILSTDEKNLLELMHETQKLFDAFEGAKSNQSGVMTESERLRFAIHSNANRLSALFGTYMEKGLTPLPSIIQKIKDLVESYQTFQEATSPA